MKTQSYLIGITLQVFVYAFLAEGKSCNGSARYTLTFQGDWTSVRHPVDFPSDPHFSAVVGCSHNSSYHMWKGGILATTGVKDVAERGNNVEINSEMDAQIMARTAHKRYMGKVIFGGTSSDSVSDIEVTGDYPLVSFITMIAPSPDWFIGVHDYSLCDTSTGEWKQRATKDLFPYDAGTDSGLTFNSNDNETIPKQNIQLLTNNTEGPFKSNQPIKSFGTFTFVNSSSTTNMPKLSFFIIFASTIIYV